MNTELIARLEAAEVGSRELDALIWDNEGDRPRHSLDGDFPTYKQDPEDSVAFDSTPSYTTSVDSALELADRLLPRIEKWRLRLRENGTFRANISVGGVDRCGVGCSAAIALCIAILSALDAQEQK